MKIGMKFNKLFYGIIIMSFLALVSPVTFAQEASVSAEPTGVEARTNITQWRYKVIGDHLYKRLYNCSTGEWETDWILVA